MSFVKKIPVDIIQKILVFFALFMAAFIIVMQSPLNFWTNKEASLDSNVYKYVAMVMSKGGMPYKDAFDHKGPLIFIINYIGQMISYYRGVWVVELISMLCFAYILYKIARLFCGRGFSCFLVFSAMAPLRSYFKEGNLTEEYAMPFLAIAIFIFIDYFVNHKISRWRLMLCGAGFGAVFLLQINAVSLWIVFCLAVVGENLLTEKKLRWDFLGWFMVGCAIVVLPIMIWLIGGGAFSYFIQDYIFFNMKYSSSMGSNLYNNYATAAVFIKCNIFLITIVSLIYLLKNKINVYFHTVYLISMVFTILLMSLTGRPNSHYVMPLIPLFIYPLSRLAGMLQEKEGENTAVLYAMILLLVIFPDYITEIDYIAETLQYPSKSIATEHETRVVLNYIEEYTNEDDEIIVIGGKDIFYVLSGRLAASKYSYQSPAFIDGRIREEFENDLRNNKPKMAIVQYDGFLDLFVTIDDYELIDVVDETLGVYLLKQ